MKNLMLLIILLCFKTFLFGHHIEKFVLTRDGIAPVVITLDSTFNKSKIFKQAKEWILLSYNTPSIVLKAEIADEYLRLNGVKKSAVCWDALSGCVDMDYDLTIEIKDGKYRLTYVINQFTWRGQSTGYSFPQFFKKDGSPKSLYGKAIPQVEESMNALNLSLYKYIVGETQSEKSEW